MDQPQSQSDAPGFPEPTIDVAQDTAEVEAQKEEKLELEKRIVAAEEVADDLDDERPLPDPELNLLTIVALLVSIPVAILLYRSRIFFAFAIPATLAGALAIFWLLRAWSVVVVTRMHKQTARAMRKFVEEARRDGPR